MYEHISPRGNHSKLYDDLADSLARLLCKINELTYCKTGREMKENFTQLTGWSAVEEVIVSLRGDSGHFNEARFRIRVKRGLGLKPWE